MKRNLLTISLVIATLSIQAQVVTIPDVNFKATLLSNTNINQNNNGEIETSEAQGVTELVVSSKSIKDLTGIEAFSGLIYLYCDNNQLTALDLSGNIALKQLYCGDNQLTTLDLSKNTGLQKVDCRENQLSKLEVSKSANLYTLQCRTNQLTELDVHNNLALNSLDCSFNLLTALDVSKNVSLDALMCNKNELTQLDVSKDTILTTLECFNNPIVALNLSTNKRLAYLYCYGNSLTSLDVSNNMSLTSLFCYNNPNLTQICINKLQVSNEGSWSKDDLANWSIDCTTAVQDGVLSSVSSHKVLLRIVSPFGQEIKQGQDTKGLFFYHYTDGSTDKVAKEEN